MEKNRVLQEEDFHTRVKILPFSEKCLLTKTIFEKSKRKKKRTDECNYYI